ncbi:MAG: flagellar hook-associated protein FlgK [Steroidobacteraceae bacterium]
MSSMMSTGVSGLLAFQTALDTTSHNISNANTVGYSRQSVSLVTSHANYTGSGYIGTGVSVSTIKRTYDDLVAAQVRSSSSSMNQWDIYSSMADQVNDLFGDATTGLSTTLQSFFNSFQSVANSPSSSSERQVLLSNAQSLTDQLQAYGSQLDQLGKQVNSQLSSEAVTISGLAQSIADLNAQISAASSRGTAPPNDMLDQRDALIDQLSTHVGISTVAQDDGSTNVFIGNGQALVVGNTANKLVTVTNAYDASRQELALQTAIGTDNITSTLSGGTVGGLLDFRSQILDPAANKLGLVATSLAEMVNDQQNAGMDLDGSLGADMFSIGSASAAASINNTGSGSLTVTRSDVGALTGDDYVLTNTSGGWTLKNARTGAAVTLSGNGTASSPFTAEGLSIEVSGTAAVGDSFLVKPVANAITGMSVVLSDPNGVAAAAPIIASASSSNTGKATITQGVVTDASNAQLRSTVNIQFLSATSYTTDGGVTTNTYTSGQPISVNGWEVTITGAPATGDTFTVQNNAGGTGDNRNALLMANLLNKDYAAAGTQSLNDVVNNWISDVGVKSMHAQSNLSVQTSLYEDNLSIQQGISGVNLDEEAANLVRYQQAYAAAAQVIATANQLFDSLMQALR